MTAPFFNRNSVFGPSDARGSVRPLAFVSAGVSAVDRPTGLLGRRDSLPAQRTGPPKRTKITPVACRPCQQRKCERDGARPVCTPCLMKKRSGCAYDAAGDQRRTSALKERIQDLETQVHDLKDITSIGSAADRNAGITLAYQLAHARFRRTAEVAHALRDEEDILTASSLVTTSKQTLKPAGLGCKAASSTSETSASSAATGDNAELHGTGETPPLSWAMDAAQWDMGLVQKENDGTPTEVSEHFAKAQRRQGMLSIGC